MIRSAARNICGREVPTAVPSAHQTFQEVWQRVFYILYVVGQRQLEFDGEVCKSAKF